MNMIKKNSKKQIDILCKITTNPQQNFETRFQNVKCKM